MSLGRTRKFLVLRLRDTSAGPVGMVTLHAAGAHPLALPIKGDIQVGPFAHHCHCADVYQRASVGKWLKE